MQVSPAFSENLFRFAKIKDIILVSCCNAFYKQIHGAIKSWTYFLLYVVLLPFKCKILILPEVIIFISQLTNAQTEINILSVHEKCFVKAILLFQTLLFYHHKGTG